MDYPTNADYRTPTEAASAFTRFTNAASDSSVEHFDASTRPPIINQPRDPDTLPQIPAGHGSPQYITVPDIPIMVPKSYADPEARLILAVFIMAGAIFWAVFTFLNRVYSIPLLLVLMKY